MQNIFFNFINLLFLSNQTVFTFLVTHIYIIRLLESATCEQKEESPCRILCQCPDLARHWKEIFSSAWLGLIGIRRVLYRMVLALVRALCRAVIGSWVHSGPSSSQNAWVAEIVVPPKSVVSTVEVYSKLQAIISLKTLCSVQWDSQMSQSWME
jgi:hypothetical protein